ncbi:signal peptidase I [Mycoplasmatota bacterium WC30]
MKEKDTTKKRKSRVANIVFWVVLAIVAIYSVIALVSTDDGVTTLFGGNAFTVQTDSMSPTFDKGDLIYIDTDVNVDTILVDDVITYQILLDVNGDGEDEWVYNSHRVINIEEDPNGYLHFTTKGDNNALADEGNIHESYVIGVWTEKVTKNIGGIIDGIVGFLQSGTGFFIFIVLPCLAFLIYEIVKFIGVMTEYKTQQILTDRVKLQEEALVMAKAQLEEEARLQALEKEKDK